MNTYGEPWKLKDGSLIWRVCDASGKPVWTDPNGDKLFGRAVDCVNALDGIANPAALPELIAAIQPVLDRFAPHYPVLPQELATLKKWLAELHRQPQEEAVIDATRTT